MWKPTIEDKDHPYGEQGIRSSLDAVAERAAKGAVDPRIRAWSIECLERARREGRKVGTERARAEVLLAAVQKKLWVPDPVGTEFMAGAHLTACVDKDAPCFHGGDCFPEGSLVLKKGHELAAIESLKPGDIIWGLGAWSEVQAVAYKGALPIDVVKLNNGSELKLTSDHHVYVLDCTEHPMVHEDGKALPSDRAWRGLGKRSGCSCAADLRQEKRIRVSELREGMVLTQPEKIPFGKAEHVDVPVDHLRAYIEGLFVADGWADYEKNASFSISGQDGCPKEEQKKEVQDLCMGMGIGTTWKKKSIAVYGKEWALRMQRMGRYAPEKHFLTIDFDEARAASSLRGVMADAGKNTRGEGFTFTTTSKLLAVQVRVLHRMFGIACGWRYIETHGGLGKNPIWRLGVRANSRKDNRSTWLLRVKNIEREVVTVPCWDIQTSDHRVYLPEHDVTVSQCDDLVVLLAACFMSVGLHSMVVGHAYNQGKNIQHVLAAVRIDKQWQYADPSTDFPVGKCSPFTRERILSVPNVQVICDETKCLSNPASFDPDEKGFVTRGRFIGVDGVPEERSRVAWIGVGKKP